MKIISYYTKQTPYETVVKENLFPSLEKWNLDYDIQAIDDKGSWQANTSYKSTFCLEMLKKHQETCVFLDSDAQIWKEPKLFWEIPFDYDIGIHWLDWYWRWRKQKGEKKSELLSGTMWLPYKTKTMDLLNNFIAEINRNPNTWEQRIMQQVIEKRQDLKVYNLPYSYIVFPNHGGAFPIHMLKEEECVIYHSQASRKYKNRNNTHWSNWKKT